MLYIPNIYDYLKILTDFLAINFSESFKSIGEKQNLRKVDKSLYIFLATPGEEEKKIKNKLKELLS